MSIMTKENLDKLKRGKKVEAIMQVDNDKHAEIKITPVKDIYKINTSLINSSNSNKIEQHQHTVKNLNVVEAMAQTLVRSMIEKDASKGKRRKHGSYKDFAARVLAVPGIFDPKSYGIRKNGRYLDVGTVRKRVTYTAFTIRKMYEKFGTLDVTDEQQKLFFNELVDDVIRSENKHGKTRQTREAVANRINTAWKGANEVLDKCRSLEPDGEWPPNRLVVFENIKAYIPELIKVLPYYRFIYAVRMLVRACEEGMQEAFAGAGLVLAGMRVGESSAIRIGDIEYRGNLLRYYVNKQVDSSVKITDKLKNFSSYRYVFFFGVLVDIVELRRKQLSDLGYSSEQIEKSFLGSDKYDPFTPIDKTKVSAFLKKILIASGCALEDLIAVEKEAMGEKGEDSDHDMTAHLFRRNFSTHAINGGIPVNVVDALLGHENDSNKKNDFAGWDNANDIVGMLNRSFYYGSMASLTNPSYSPICLSNTELIAKGNNKYTFVISNAGTFRGRIESLEADDDIEIHIEGFEDEIPISVQAVIDTAASRKDRVVLPNLPSEETIEEWIGVADQIWYTNMSGGYRNEE